MGIKVDGWRKCLGLLKAFGEYANAVLGKRYFFFNYYSSLLAYSFLLICLLDSF